MPQLPFPSDFPAALRSAAEKIFAFWLEKGREPEALAAFIGAEENRAWLIEQAQALKVGRALDDTYPLNVMVHDGACTLIGADALAAEEAEVLARQPFRSAQP